MTYFLVSIFCLVLVFLLLLFIPINFCFNGSVKTGSEKSKYTGKVLIGGKRFGISISFIHGKVIGVGPYSKPWFFWNINHRNTITKTKEKRTSSRWNSIINNFQEKTILGKLIIRSIRWKNVSLSGKLQLADPMVTGILFGMIHTIFSVIPNQLKSITIKPKFDPLSDTNIDGLLRFEIFPISLSLKLIQFRLNSYLRKENS